LDVNSTLLRERVFENTLLSFGEVDQDLSKDSSRSQSWRDSSLYLTKLSTLQPNLTPGSLILLSWFIFVVVLVLVLIVIHFVVIFFLFYI